MLSAPPPAPLLEAEPPAAPDVRRLLLTLPAAELVALGDASRALLEAEAAEELAARQLADALVEADRERALLEERLAGQRAGFEAQLADARAARQRAEGVRLRWLEGRALPALAPAAPLPAPVAPPAPPSLASTEAPARPAPAAAPPAPVRPAVPAEGRLIDRVLAVVQSDRSREWRVPEIAEACGAERGSVSSLVSTLTTEGKISRVDRGVYKAVRPSRRAS